MLHSLAAVTVLVPDYDEGLAFFRDALGFTVLEDAVLSPGKRWLVVAPPAEKARRSCSLFRAMRIRDARSAARPADGSASLFTPDDFRADYENSAEARG